MNNNCVSVIVPVYNVEEFLVPVSRAVLNQTYANIELILVENGSTDKTPEICDLLAEEDSRVRVVHTDKQGVSAARNEGIRQARGRWIAFSDSDDQMAPNMIEVMQQNLVRHEADLVICGFRHMDSKTGEEIEVVYGMQHQFQQEDLFLHLDLLLTGQICHAVWNKLFCREVIVNNHLEFREDMQIGEDLVFNLDYFDCAKKVFCIAEPLYNHYLNRIGSITNTFCPHYYNQQKTMLHRLKEALTKVSPMEGDGKNYYEKAYVDMMSAAVSYLFYPEAGLNEKKELYAQLNQLKKDKEYFRCAKSQWLTLSLKKKVLVKSLKGGFYGMIYPLYRMKQWKTR